MVGLVGGQSSNHWCSSCGWKRAGRAGGLDCLAVKRRRSVGNWRTGCLGWRCCPRRRRKLRMFRRARGWRSSWDCALNGEPCGRSCNPRFLAGCLRSGLGCEARRRWSYSGWSAAGWPARLWRRQHMGGQMTRPSLLLGVCCGASPLLCWIAKPRWLLVRSSPSSCSPVSDDWRCELPVVDGGSAWCLWWSASSRWRRYLVPASIHAGFLRGGFVRGRLDWCCRNWIRQPCCEQMSWQRCWPGRWD